MRNEVVLKIGMGYVKMYGFHGKLLYDSGVGLQIQSYLNLRLPSEFL